MTLVLLAVLAAAPTKPKVEVPMISEEWLQKADDCEKRLAFKAQAGETPTQVMERAEAADQAFTDEVAMTCGFTSREQHDRFRVRLGAAVAEVMAPMAMQQVSGLDLKALARVEAAQKKELKAGRISKTQYNLVIARYQQTERAAKAYQAWSKRKPNPPSLDVSLVILGIKNPSYAAGYDLLVEQGKMTPAQRKKALADTEATVKRTEAWAKEQPALTPAEVAAQAAWLQTHNLATQQPVPAP